MLCTVLVVIVFVFALTQRVRHPAVLWSAWVRAAPVVPPVGHHLLLPLTSSEFLWTVCKQFPVKLDFLSAWPGIPEHSLFTGMLIVARKRQNKGNRGQEDEARPCFQW